ncbi:MAG: Bax inhibitor-1/YccA family protein [Gammaproteobacteria bacterium]|nr:Bax inhibitor-1/YccA family protein [Gammaproteobacteria bacterium]
MNSIERIISRSETSHAETRNVAGHKVLRNTYMLLSMTLLFSGFTAGMSMTFNLPHPGFIITLVGYFGLLFLTTKFRNSSLGILCVFALTGFMGLTLGPIIQAYLNFPNGAEIVTMAMAGTGVIFLTLSAYAITSRRDFSFMGSFLMVGIIVAFLAGIAAFFFSMPGLSLAVSAMFVLLMSGLILYQTSSILNGGETNYIMATVTLYITIYNLFTSLLHLLGAFSSDD